MPNRSRSGSVTTWSFLPYPPAPLPVQTVQRYGSGDGQGAGRVPGVGTHADKRASLPTFHVPFRCPECRITAHADEADPA
jgi:hypothetical protein